MLVFADKERYFHGPAKDDETEYRFLDRSACTHSGIARETVNKWFSRFVSAANSEGKSEDLLSSLQERKRHNRFNEALLEIVTHELLAATGHTVQIDPSLVASSQTLTPDFLFELTNSQILVECTVKLGNEHPNKHQAIKKLWDWINQNVDTHGYMIFISEVHRGDDNPKLRELRQALENQTQRMNSRGEDSLDDFEHTDKSGFRIRLSLHKGNVSRRASDNHSRNIGMYPPETYWGNGSDLLEEAVSRKAERYRELNKPLLVVLGSGGRGHACGAPALLHGMLGSNVYDDWGSRHISLLAADMNRTLNERRVKASFGFLTEPRNRNVSAVLYKPDFGLWTLGLDNWVVLHNPFTESGYEFPLGLFPFALEISFDATYRAKVSPAGTTALEILGLPEGWYIDVECPCSPYSRADIEEFTKRVISDFTGQES